MLVEANGMVDLLKGYFPTLDYAISSLTSDSIVVALIELLKVLVFTISGVIVYVFIAQKIYFKGLVGNLFSSSSKKKNIKLIQINIIIASYIKVIYLKNLSA